MNSHNVPNSQSSEVPRLPVDKKSAVGKKVKNSVLKGPKTIKIAGKKILAMPLESMGFTSEQQKKFEEIGGLMNPPFEIVNADENQDRMMYWTKSFEIIKIEIHGIFYNGFDLFKRVYEAFPDIRSMTKDEAVEAGLYPIIHYRNFSARKWMAEINGGHLATLDENYDGELHDIYNAATGNTNLEKLASIGQAPFGWYIPGDVEVYDLGDWAGLGSDSFNDYGDVRALVVYSGDTDTGGYWYWRDMAVSSIVVLD